MKIATFKLTLLPAVTMLGLVTFWVEDAHAARGVCVCTFETDGQYHTEHFTIRRAACANIASALACGWLANRSYGVVPADPSN